MPEILETNVKIKADASSLKKESNESVEALERLQEKYKEVSATLSQAFAQNGKADYIASLTEQRNELSRLINELKSGTIDASSSAIANVLNGVDTSGIKEVQEDVKDVNNELTKTQQLQRAINVGWDTSGLKNISNMAKRIAASMIGVRSVFSLISKSMNTYLSQNDALRDKLNSIYYALGSMFAPILEWLVNLFAKLITYLNAFLKGLGFAGIQFKSIASGAGKTQKAMQKVKTLIAGFDELNIFNKQASDAAGAAGGAGGIGDVDVNPEWMEKLRKLGETLRPYLEWIWEMIKKIFNWLLDHIELVIAALLVIKGIGLIIKIVEIAKKIKGIYDIIKTIISSTGLGAVLKMISGIGLIIGGLVTSVIAFVDMWKNGWSVIGEIVKDIGIALAAVGAILLGAPAAIAGIVAAIVAVLSSLAIVIHENWDDIKVWLSKTWTKIKETAEKIWTDLSNKVQEIHTNFVNWMKTNWENFKSWLSATWTSIRNNAQTIWTNLKDTVASIVTALKNQLQNLWENIKITAINIWNDIKTNLTNILTNIKNTFMSIWENIKNGVVSFNQSISDSIKRIWDGIVGVIKGAINGIIGFINGMIRGVVNGVNAVIGVLNRFSIRIPSWVPGYGGKSFGFSLNTLSAPQIAYLAKGGVLTSPTLAMMGEYAGVNSNPEIVTPQNLLQDMLESNNAKLVGSFAQMTQQVIAAIESVDMEVSIGDETIARSAAKGNNNYKAMTGRSLITV